VSRERGKICLSLNVAKNIDPRAQRGPFSTFFASGASILSLSVKKNIVFCERRELYSLHSLRAKQLFKSLRSKDHYLPVCSEEYRLQRAQRARLSSFIASDARTHFLAERRPLLVYAKELAAFSSRAQRALLSSLFASETSTHFFAEQRISSSPSAASIPSSFSSKANIVSLTIAKNVNC
jgi:hypothetical protein